MGLVGSRQFAMLTLGMSLPLLFSFQLQAPPVFLQGVPLHSGEVAGAVTGSTLNPKAPPTAPANLLSIAHVLDSSMATQTCRPLLKRRIRDSAAGRCQAGEVNEFVSASRGTRARRQGRVVSRATPGRPHPQIRPRSPTEMRRHSCAAATWTLLGSVMILRTAG